MQPYYIEGPGGGLTIAPDGNIGMGMDMPKQKLHLADENILLSKISPTVSTTPKGALLFEVDVNNSWCIEFNDLFNGLNFWKHTTPIFTLSSLSILFLNNNGNVGIGTYNPQTKLDVNGSLKAQTAEFTGSAFFNGNVGIGIATPQATLDVNGSLKAQSANIAGALSAQSANIAGAITAGGALSAQSANIFGNTNITGTLTANTLNISNATIATITGNTNITGTLSANLLIAPNANISGKIKTKEVEVTLSGWSDFVFEEDYNLMPLIEVKQFITENKHLPNVPSAAEVEANGINLGEMNAILIQKVEELTLYILDLQNQINELKTK